ncbi:hypothetical protein B0A49_08530 [Cryomyces minteri]|uniref:Protein kinase domain-containing protein n=1 Tax=Cryomyces minteri TaxID=331657 RepID=A0A4U0WFT0_9PEZI|nr:hypothetical protein B0A49_08322 [Cryomyces minteri]TKA61710.1 hypothetical protein B0A49_08530 [Cryomyces minteri]
MASHPEPDKHDTMNAPGILPSRDVELNLPITKDGDRPLPIRHIALFVTVTGFPLRMDQSKFETLNARSHYGSSDDDGTAVHKINQYTIKQEIGRGSFGAVHLAVDQYGKEFAVKEFSKSRLRKRAQSNLLRRPDQARRPGHLAAGRGFNSPLHRLSSSDKADESSNNSLDLIKEEIAIMKKLNHTNLVALIEVLDDPDEDSLYMVLEMCKKGVVMNVSVDERADPYDQETCRCWFRDMILGIEYLHAQGVVHRDIKPDNCLITEDDVLKIVDFGVSEMFEKQSDMATTKSAGSPAFMPPELCVARHGQVSGRAADIWSMGATLYCLRYGRIPFEKTSVLEMYESIRTDELEVEDETNEDFYDLIHQLLEKDPLKRITMDRLREHPWVTKRGTDPLLSAEENTANLVQPPTEAELAHAITGNVGQLLVVMRAVKRFKKLLVKRRPELMEGIFGRASRIVQPPLSIQNPSKSRRSKSQDTDDRRPLEQVLTVEGIHRDIEVTNDLERLPKGMDLVARTSDQFEAPPRAQASEHEAGDHHMREMESPKNHPGHATGPHAKSERQDTGKGHAHDPLSDTLFLGIGSSADCTAAEIPDVHVVSESPGAVDIDIYEKAYQEETQRITESKGKEATLFLTRRVEGNREIREQENVIAYERGNADDGARTGLAKLIDRARQKESEADTTAGEDETDTRSS